MSRIYPHKSALSTFPNEEKNKAASATYHIQKFTGVLGAVNASVLQIGDCNSIHAELKNLGIPQEERVKLETILDSVKDAMGENTQLY
jgi:hypothetical protein